MTTETIDRWVAGASPTVLQPVWRRLRSSPLSFGLARGVFWSLVGSIVTRGLGVACAVITARILGIGSFGEFTIIQSTVGLFGTFAGLGLGITATKYAAELRQSDPVRGGRTLGLILSVAAVGGVIAGALLTVFAPWFATNTMAAPHLAPTLRSAAGLVLIGTLQGVYAGGLAGLEAFRKAARVNWITALAGSPVVVFATWAGGLEGAVWGSVAQGALGCLVGHVVLSRECSRLGMPLSWVADVRDLHILWRFTLPAFLSSVLVGPANWLCNMWLVHQNQGFQEVALLNAAGQWKNLLGLVPMMIASVLVPMLARLHNSGQTADYARLLRRSLVLVVSGCFLMALPLSVLAPHIMDAYGPGFIAGVPVFVLSAMGTGIVAANNLLSRAMQASGQAWTEFTFSLLWAVALCLSCWFLIPTWRAQGIAIAHLLAGAALGVWQWLLLRRPARTAVFVRAEGTR